MCDLLRCSHIKISCSILFQFSRSNLHANIYDINTCTSYTRYNVIHRIESTVFNLINVLQYYVYWQHDIDLFSTLFAECSAARSDARAAKRQSSRPS